MNCWKYAWVCLFPVVFGCGVNSDEATEEPTWSAKSQAAGCDSAGCISDSQCVVFNSCQTGGWIACNNGKCVGYKPDYVNFECVLNASCAGSVNTGGSGGGANCGYVSPPPEMLAYDAADANCNFFAGKQPNEDQFRAWLQVTADKPGSTITVHSLSGYCVQQNNALTPASGTAIGQPAISWAGHYRRDTWYHPTDPVATLQGGQMTYEVPTNPLLLHLGNGGSAAGCKEIILFAEISTTGDAKVELGLDYYTGNVYSHESCVSGWKSCSTGVAKLMTPWSGNLTCEGGLPNNQPPPAKNPCDGVSDGTVQPYGGGTQLGECHAGQRQCNNGTWVVISSSVESVPEVCGDNRDNDCDGSIDNGCTTPNSCPPTGLKITPGPALLGPCPSLITKTWGLNKQYTSSPGQSLYVTDSWSGYAYVETACNGQEGSWQPGVTLAQAGFSEVCSQGQNVTSSTFVCWDQYSGKYRPTVPLSPFDAGHCP